MDFYNRILSKDVFVFGIDDFDTRNRYNVNQLKNVFKSLFFNNDILYFSFRREENLTDERELKQLRVKVLEKFNSEGEYHILRQLDESRFDSVARIEVKESTFDFLFDVWNYFYSCTFFIPKDEFTFSDFILSEKVNKFQDLGNEKLLKNHNTDFTCIKGLGGDSLIVSYRKDYKLPDLKKMALDTPDKNEIFR